MRFYTFLSDFIRFLSDFEVPIFNQLGEDDVKKFCPIYLNDKKQALHCLGFHKQNIKWAEMKHL